MSQPGKLANRASEERSDGPHEAISTLSLFLDPSEVLAVINLLRHVLTTPTVRLAFAFLVRPQLAENDGVVASDRSTARARRDCAAPVHAGSGATCPLDSLPISRPAPALWSRSAHKATKTSGSTEASSSSDSKPPPASGPPQWLSPLLTTKPLVSALTWGIARPSPAAGAPQTQRGSRG